MGSKLFFFKKNFIFIIISIIFYNPIYSENTSIIKKSDEVKNKQELRKNIDDIKRIIDSLNVRILDIEKFVLKEQDIKELKFNESKVIDNKLALYPKVIEKTDDKIEVGKLIFVSKEVKQIGSNYLLFMQFKTNNMNFISDTSISFKVAGLSVSEIQNISFSKLKKDIVKTTISEDKKLANITVNLNNQNSFTIMLFLSQKTILNISGNSGLESFTIDFEK